MIRGNICMTLPFIFMLILASCQQAWLFPGKVDIPIMIHHADGITTEYHDFEDFGNG